MLSPEKYAIVCGVKATIGAAEKKPKTRKKAMKKKTTKTAAKPQGAKEQVRAKLNEQLAQKEARVFTLAARTQKMRWADGEAVILLEGIAIEMRSLAYQIRMLKVAKLALDAAE